MFVAANTYEYSTSVLRRRLQQRRMIGIAADDSMHGDDISRRDAVSDHREVADHALKTVAHLARLGFAAGGVEIRRRGVDKRRRLDAIRQQFEVEDADAPTDIEQRSSAGDVAAQSAEEQTRCRVRTLSPVAAQVSRGYRRAELSLRTNARHATGTAVHGLRTLRRSIRR